MKKFIITLFICMILVAPLVSAADWDNVKSYDKDKQEITIKNAFGLPFIGNDLAMYKLQDNTDQCLTDCYAEGKAEFYSEGYLFTDMQFKNKRSEEIDLSYSKIFIEEFEDYTYQELDGTKEVCREDNITHEEVCTNEEVYKDAIGKRKVWVEYDGRLLQPNTYRWRIEGTKLIKERVDWIGSSFGVEFSEWAWWDTDWAKCRDLDFSTADTYTSIITTVNVTDIVFTNATKEIRIVDASCDNDGSEVLRTVLDAGTDWAYITFLLDGTGAMEYSVYYDNVGASTPSDLVLFWDEFNVDGLDTTKWGYNDTSGTLNVTDGYLGFDGDGNWGGINSITQFSTGFLWAEKKNDGADHHVMGFTDDPEITQRATIYWFGANRKFNIPTENVYGRDNSLLNYTISWDGGGAGNCYSLSLPDNEGVSVANCASGSSVLRLKAHGIDIYNFVRVYPFGTNYTGEPQSWTIGSEESLMGLNIENSVPEDNFKTTESSITFGCNASVTGEINITSIILSVTGDAIWNQTISGLNTDSYNATFVNSTLLDGDYLWKCFGFGDLANGSSNTRSFSKDVTLPIIDITSPSSISEINKNLGNESLNWTITDTNLDSCWFEYNNTNTTLPCISGIANSTIFTTIGQTYLTVYANDTFGNINSSFVEWEYKIFQNSETFNSSTFETASETYSINVTANSSLTAANLIWNGTTYEGTKSGDVWSAGFDIPIGTENKSFNWDFTYAGDTISSDSNNITIGQTIFALCNSTLDVIFLNITFKDEADSEVLNASIPTSTFNYFLGSGEVTKTLTFINNTNNFEYDFCATPNRTLKTSAFIQYKQGTEYPQRVFDRELISLTNETLDSTLFLLSSIDGIFVTFQVINVAEQPIQGVDVTSNRTIATNSETVGQGTTDSAGAVTFWLNPDFIHTTRFVKTGFDVFTLTAAPTQSIFTITLGGAQEVVQDARQGIVEIIAPRISHLDNDTVYDFNYTISSGLANLDSYGYSLFYGNDTLIETKSGSTDTGSILQTSNVNTLNASQIYMTYFYIANSTRVNGTRTWRIDNTEGRDFSIFRFFEDITLYIGANMFGIAGEDATDQFGKALISFTILVLVAGGLSFRYGIQSEVAIMGIIFGIVLFLDVGIGLIPNPDFGGLNPINNLVTVITGIILAGTLIREELR